MQSKAKIFISRGNITTFATDAVVNAANIHMLGGGGVDGAIHRHAGPELRAYCEQLPVRGTAENRLLIRCHTGSCIITPGFKLPCKWIIHTVGPIWEPEDEFFNEGAAEEMLADCYANVLTAAMFLGIKSIAIPAISTGVYGFPRERAAKIAVQTLSECLEELDGDECFIHLVAFTEEDALILQEALDTYAF
jgi:O-acetyl-ADP-ribose deacetylase (regulator of RNase III)